jgi:hypothetical protein
MTAKCQKVMQRSADQRVLDAYKTFNEIMTGPNPLTTQEIRRLIDERGGIWHLFEMWAAPKS